MKNEIIDKIIDKSSKCRVNAPKYKIGDVVVYREEPDRGSGYGKYHQSKITYACAYKRYDKNEDRVFLEWNYHTEETEEVGAAAVGEEDIRAKL